MEIPLIDLFFQGESPLINNDSIRREKLDDLMIFIFF